MRCTSRISFFKNSFFTKGISHPKFSLRIQTFQSPLLPGLHGIAVIDPCSFGAVCRGFYAVSVREFRPPVSQQDVDIFPEELRAGDEFQQVDALLHGKSRFSQMEDGEEQAGADELKGLDKRAFRAVVIDDGHIIARTISYLFPNTGGK